MAGRSRRGKNAGIEQHDRPRGRQPGTEDWWRYPWDSSGWWTGWSSGAFGFGGEESAGASFLRRDGTVWTTDKDGIIMGLLSAEILARTGRDPGEIYRGLTEKFGAPVYERIDAPATPEQKAVLLKLSPEQLHASDFAGREDRGHADHGARERRAHRRAESGNGEWLVRGAPVGHGSRL